MGLFMPAWLSKNEDKALLAISKMTDDAKLAQAAKEAVSWQVSKAAMEKICNQKLIADVVKHAKNKWSILGVHERDKALNMLAIATSNMLNRLPYELPIFEEKYDVRMDAINRIHDQAVLCDIASDKELQLYIRLAAAAKLEDEYIVQDVYADAARHGWDTGVKFFDKITRQDILADIARNAKDPLVRLEMAKRLEDENIAQEVYADIALHASKLNRLSAIERLTNKAVLLEISKNTKDEYLCDKAYERLNTLI